MALIREGMGATRAYDMLTVEDTPEYQVRGRNAKKSRPQVSRATPGGHRAPTQPDLSKVYPAYSDAEIGLLCRGRAAGMSYELIAVELIGEPCSPEALRSLMEEIRAVPEKQGAEA